jgi:hypothetical protein
MLLIILGTVLNFYTNDVVIKRADSTITPTIGMEIQDNDTIIVKDSSEAEVIYPDSSTLYIDENSKIVTEGLGKRSVFISIGRVWAKIRKLVRGESFEVKNPLSVSGVIGTEFEVSYLNDESVVKVVDGRVTTRSEETGREVILEMEKMARVRRNAEMEVKAFKLKEMKKWYEWKKDHLDFLLRKIEEALKEGRGMQASRLITQGYVLAKRLNLTDEYKSKIDKLLKKYEPLNDQHGAIEDRLNNINLSYNTIMLEINRKESQMRELDVMIKNLSKETAELKGYVTRQRTLLAKQQLTAVNYQNEQIETLIKNIKPQNIYEWQQKIENDYQFLKDIQKRQISDRETASKIKITAKRVEELREKVKRLKAMLVKDIETYKKLNAEITGLKRQINLR